MTVLQNETGVAADIRVTGTVQGVGFRPFIFRLAKELALNGFVRNCGAFVEITIAGKEQSVTDFIARIKTDAPPVARIQSIEVVKRASGETQFASFQILESEACLSTLSEVPPDLGTCEECLNELFDAGDRRYRYPFINCTNCGPRFTIIGALPYDRPATTMACFPMCDLCTAEYQDPLDRRFHAQPNACEECGPSLKFYRPDRQQLETSFRKDDNQSSIASALKCLEAGLIVAIKGLGGFHLACDATNQAAVERLRSSKGRPAKPFALMMRDVEMVRKFCAVTEAEQALLQSVARPIVLLEKRDGETLAAGIAPDSYLLGVMLPYTPLQHILLRDFGKPLVMTSGNFSDDPIATGNREAIERLGTICDAFLLNNRDIDNRYDDTVTRIVDGAQGVIRRARGYSPAPIQLAVRAKKPILSVGGHLKNTFCLIVEDRAYLSQHIGDLDTVETVEQMEKALSNYVTLFGINPELIAHDLHPDYGSTAVVKRWWSPLKSAPIDVSRVDAIIPIQHHFAHIVSCMADNGVSETVIGIAFDGIGYGEDGNLWGGEFLLCDLKDYERAASLKNASMPGSFYAIKEPWRMALSYLVSCGESSWIEKMKARFSIGDQKKFQLVHSQLSKNDGLVETSSCGRLFDAVSSLSGLCDVAHCEAQAAIVLEKEAHRYLGSHSVPEPYEFEIVLLEAGSNNRFQPRYEINTLPIIQNVVSDLKKDAEIPLIAARFHETVAQIILRQSRYLKQDRGINEVCLSGGVFQNKILCSRAKLLLESDGFTVYTHRAAPANDGGLALGQAVAGLSQSGMLER